MSNKQLVKPKTETKTEITTEQSQKLLQTMLTMSFGCLAFLRGLFPDDIFVDQRFVPGLHLDGRHDEFQLGMSRSSL